MVLVAALLNPICCCYGAMLTSLCGDEPVHGCCSSASVDAPEKEAHNPDECQHDGAALTASLEIDSSAIISDAFITELPLLSYLSVEEFLRIKTTRYYYYRSHLLYADNRVHEPSLYGVFLV